MYANKKSFLYKLLILNLKININISKNLFSAYINSID